jgi:hypothetical protein
LAVVLTNAGIAKIRADGCDVKPRADARFFDGVYASKKLTATVLLASSVLAWSFYS